MVTPEKTASITLSYQGVAVSEDEMAAADTELGQRQRKYLSDDRRAMLTVTDPAEIQEILAASTSCSVTSLNPLMDIDYGMGIDVDMKQSVTKYGVNVDQLKSSDAAADTEVDTFEDADDDDLYDDDVYDLDDDEEIEDEDYGSFSRRFYYGQIPQFVIDEFGLTPEIMEQNKS